LLINRGVCSISTNAAAIGIVKVEEETARKAHWLDGDELICNETTENAADDWECDVCEAADVAATIATESVCLTEDLCCLVLEECRHVLTCYIIKTTKKTCAVPLLNKALVLGANVTLTNTFC
jgi:hypothetical protein